MAGLIKNRVWDQVPCPNNELIAETNMLHKRKKNKRGEVGTHKYRFVATGFRQVRGLRLKLKHASTDGVRS